MLPLQFAAKGSGAAIVGVHHTVKSGRIAGTKGITDAARMVIKVQRNANDPKIRVIHVDKCNIASDAIGDVAYTITGQWPDTGVEYIDVPDDAIAEDARRPTTRERILALLQGASAPMDGQEVASKLDLSYGAARVALFRLAREDCAEVYSPSRGMWWTIRGPQLEVVK